MMSSGPMKVPAVWITTSCREKVKEWGGNIDVTGYVQEKDVIHLCVSSSATVNEVTDSYTIHCMYNRE